MQLGVGLGAAALAAAMVAAAPAPAQDASEIDALIDGAATPGTALSLAHRQSDSGDLMGAAATLERHLLGDPQSAAVRLYYASVLCRLGDGQTARVELARVDGRNIDDTAWAEARAACGDVERPAARRGSEGLHGQVAMGLAYDSDLAGSLLVQLDLPGALPRDDGLSFAGSARLAGRTAIGRSAWLYGDGGVLTRDHVSGPDADYQTGDLELGFGTRAGSAELLLGGIVRHTRVAGDPFVTDFGAAAGLALLMGDGRLTLRGEVVQQDYMGSTPAFSRDGLHYDAALGWSGSTGTTGYWLGAAWERKDADTARTGYSGLRAWAGLREALGTRGAYATLAGAIRHVGYADQIGFAPVSETRWFSRAAVGLPLGPDGLDIEAAGSYSWRVYNHASGFRDYENIGAELRLVWNFGQ